MHGRSTISAGARQCRSAAQPPLPVAARWIAAGLLTLSLGGYLVASAAAAVHMPVTAPAGLLADGGPSTPCGSGPTHC